MNLECWKCNRKYDGFLRFTIIKGIGASFCEYCLKYDRPERLSEKTPEEGKRQSELASNSKR
jgi:hypothetical protein